MRFFLVTLVASILVLSQGEPVATSEKPELDPIAARQEAIDHSCDALQSKTKGQMSEDNSCQFSCVDAAGNAVITNNFLPNFTPCTLTEEEPLKGQCYEGQCEKYGSRPQPRALCLYGNWVCWGKK